MVNLVVLGVIVVDGEGPVHDADVAAVVRAVAVAIAVVAVVVVVDDGGEGVVWSIVVVLLVIVVDGGSGGGGRNRGLFVDNAQIERQCLPTLDLDMAGR